MRKPVAPLFYGVGMAKRHHVQRRLTPHGYGSFSPCRISRVCYPPAVAVVSLNPGASGDGGSARHSVAAGSGLNEECAIFSRVRYIRR